MLCHLMASTSAAAAIQSILVTCQNGGGSLDPCAVGCDHLPQGPHVQYLKVPMEPDRVRFSTKFCLKCGIDFITFCLKQGILIYLKGKDVHLKLGKWYKKLNLYPCLLALMPEAGATTKLDKELRILVRYCILRPGLKKLHAVLNRVGKSDISVSNRVRV